MTIDARHYSQKDMCIIGKERKRRKGSFIGEIFIQERFWPKICPFLGPIFDFGGFLGVSY